ncbi:MAG: hypothetical protein PSV35_09135 [bacterium]|nr:hypothetical protein [bacterium]
MNTQKLQDKLEQHITFLKQDEHNVPLLIEISSLFCDLGDIDSAQKYLDRVHVIDSKVANAPQGLLYLNQGDLLNAQKYLQMALHDCDTPAIRYNLGFTYFLSAEFEQAIDLLRPLIDKEHYPSAELLMARILHRQDELEQAIHYIEHILEYNPDDAEALGFLSLIYFDMNEELLAKELSQKALAINAEIYDARLVNIVLRLMTQETTIEEIEELLRINPQDSRLWFALGSTHMTLGDLNSAEHTLLKAIEVYPEFYDCHIALAWCQLLNDHIKEAHETYQNAIELVDDLADAWGGLALVHALSNDLIKTEQLIEKANSINSECFLTEIAEIIYFNQTNPEQAKKSLVNMLNNTAIPISEKLAGLIEEI